MKTIRTCVVAMVLPLVFSVSADANAPLGRYTTSGGTVYDTKTKLTWQQAAPATTYAWADAKTYCASATVSSALGGSGWRLPTVKELQTLVDYTTTSAPVIDPTFQGPAAYFRSSSPVAGSPANAWGIDFTAGYIALAGVTDMAYVRCVR
jgi:formylglycine-generating enzyme required for sulfatase activity